MENKKDLFQNLLNNKNANELHINLQSSTANGEIKTQHSTTKEVKEEKSDYKKALDYAIRILGLRDYSEYKMREKLKQRQCTKDDIDLVIQKLLDLNYLREEEYTRQRIKQLLVKGYANSYILQKINQEHLKATREDIEALRSENELESDSQIDYLISKKLRGKEIPSEFEAKMKLKNKITRFLISKGYQFSEVNTALTQYFK